MDEPQQAFYFEWHLVDPRDDPYAVFRLYYRSVKSLEQSSLISRKWWEGSPVIPPKTNQTFPQTPENPKAASEEKKTYQLISVDETVFDDEASVGLAAATGRPPEWEPVSYFLSPPKLPRPSPASSHRLPQPSKAVRDAFRDQYLDRPLPKLPMDEARPDHERHSFASASSVSSETPALTPFSQEYVDSGAFESDSVEFGVAKAVRLPRVCCVSHGAGPAGELKEKGSATSSVSDYEVSPPFTDKLGPPLGLSLGQCLPTTGSMLPAQPDDSSPRQETPPPRNMLPECRTSQGMPLFAPLQLSEPEWMRYSPPASERGNPAACRA